MSFTDEPKQVKLPKGQASKPAVARVDDNVHRNHQRFADGTEEIFSAQCRYCIKLDRERKQPVPESELERTIFLYPRGEEALCVEWLQHAYPEIDPSVLNHGSAMPVWQLVSASDVSIVCVRPLADVGGKIEPREVMTKDAILNKLVLVPNDRAKLLAQVAASEPLRVGELCTLTSGAAGRIAITGRWDASALIKRIYEAFPYYTVQVPDQRNTHESLTVS